MTSDSAAPLQRGEVARWLQSVLQPGDLVLTGSTDRLSRLVRWGTLSKYSHAALALTSDRLIESYDWGGTPAESDDGVSQVAIEDFVSRGNLVRLAVLRPSGLDASEFGRICEFATHHSPPFPSSTGVLLAFAGLGDHPKRRIPGAKRYVEKRLHLLGDGAARVTCAEFVARVYLEAGVNLRFQTVRLLYYVELLRPTNASVRLQDRTEPRQATPPPKVGTPSRSLLAYVRGLPRAVAASSADRTQPDWADLLVPGDFCHSSSFETIAERDVA